MKNRYVVLLTSFFVSLVFIVFVSYYLFVAVLSRDGSAKLLLPSYDTVVNGSDSYTNEVVIVNDGLNLQGYMMEQESASWMIVVHGYNTSGQSMYWASSQFYKMGYNVLAIDLRGHGSSDGSFVGLGYLDQYDIVAWIDYLESYDKDCLIGLYGVSMGASAIMNAATLGLSEQVKVIIEDSGFSNPYDVFSYHMQDTFTVPTFPFLNITNLIVQAKLGFNLKSGPIVGIENNTIPILFIHGDKDSLIPLEMAKDLYDQTVSEKELYIIENAGHVEGNEMDREYWNNVYAFTKKNGL